MSELRVQAPPAMPKADVDPRFRVQAARVGALQLQLGIQTTAPATRLEDYGPTSHLSEDLLIRAYGLIPTRREEEGR